MTVYTALGRHVPLAWWQEVHHDSVLDALVNWNGENRDMAEEVLRHITGCEGKEAEAWTEVTKLLEENGFAERTRDGTWCATKKGVLYVLNSPKRMSA